MSVVSYLTWREVNEPLIFNTALIQKQMEALSFKPLVSVLVAVYNTDERFLRECLNSVLAQSYQNWELCIADDCSTQSYIKPLLEEYSARDSRIKVVYRPENGHISQASNSALEQATGDYIALLDHDDLLAEHALFHVVQALNENREAKVLYSDEDKIDEVGIRFNPHFKTDWNPDLLYSHNYVTHLLVIDTALVREKGGFRLGVEGSQDYDLLLRCTENLKTSEINHIPYILYHWRAIQGSTALSSGEKNYTSEAGLEALRAFMSRKYPDNTVEHGSYSNSYRVQWSLPEEQPLVSLMIPTRDGYDVLKQCVDSILAKTDYNNYEVLILNNQSTCKKTLQYFNEISGHSKVKIVSYDRPFNFSAINNFGMEQANGDIIGLINNDIEVISSNWLTEMVSHSCRSDIGCVGAKLYYPDNRIQHAGVILGIGGVAGHAHKYFQKNALGYVSRLKLTQNYSAVTAAALLVRKEIYLEVGGMDEQLQVAFNDIDFCLKVREAGYRNLWSPFAELYHHESISRGAEDTPEKQERFGREIQFMKSKWAEKLVTDPYYSPNLTLEHENFSYRV